MDVQAANFQGLVGTEPHYQPPRERVEVPDVAGKLVDRLFANLKAYSPAWKQAFETEADYNETKQVWLKTLIQQGVCNAKSLKRGLEKASVSASPFFPSVGQFVAWCREEDYHALGLPTLDELRQRWARFLGYARFAKAQFKYRSKAEYWLLSELYRKCWNKPESELEKVMAKLLDEAADKVKSDFAFPDIPLAIEKKSPPFDPEKAAENIAKIKQRLGVTQ